MKKIVKFVVGVVLVLAALQFMWLWGFCRFYVGPDRMAIITAKNGKPLGPAQILAHKGQKGIWDEPLAEGRHFLNPIFYDHQIRQVTIIPPGKVGIVTSKVGEELPEGEFIAERFEHRRFA